MRSGRADGAWMFLGRVDESTGTGVFTASGNLPLTGGTVSWLKTDSHQNNWSLECYRATTHTALWFHTDYAGGAAQIYFQTPEQLYLLRAMGHGFTILDGNQSYAPILDYARATKNWGFGTWARSDDTNISWYFYDPEFAQLFIGCGTAGQQARISFNGPNRYFCAGLIGDEFQIWDLTVGAKRFAIDQSGNVHTSNLTGGGSYTYTNYLTAVYMGCTDHIDISKSGGGGYLWTNGYVSTPVLVGGPYNSGLLRCWNTGNNVCFRWGDGSLFYRVDEAVEHRILYTSTGAIDFRVIGGQPGATGVGTFVTQAGTAYGWYVDYVSDPRFKRNVAPSKVDALGLLNRVDVIEYDWDAEALKEAGEHVTDAHVALGLNARQLLDFMPEMVGQHEGMSLRLNLKEGVPFLIRAIQQLSQRLSNLEKGVNLHGLR
jgi:hypothetical protein